MCSDLQSLNINISYLNESASSDAGTIFIATYYPVSLCTALYTLP